MKRLILLLLLAQICFSIAVVNSFDGRDVVSAIYYGALTGEKVVFVAPNQDPSIAYAKIGSNNNVLLIQSASVPAVVGMADTLRNKGNTVEMYTSEDPYKTNLDLARRSGAKKFVLVDPVYGYNTVSVLAYAKLNSMYLIFVDKSNMNSVAAFLRERGAQEVLLYGYVDPEVKALLGNQSISYKEINNGDKFDDNLALLDLYFKQNPSKKQVILSDGNAIDDTLATGSDPVVLISSLVPQATYDYIKKKVGEGQILTALVVDQEYAQTAYNLKKSVNKEVGNDSLHVFVKFGESATASGQGMVAVGLFPLPGPQVGLKINSAEYNSGTKKLEVVYENTGNAPEFVRSQIVVYVDGRYVATVGDETPFMLNKNEKLGRAYAVEVEDGAITVNITAMYGSSKKYNENGLRVVLNAGRVQFIDRSELNISEFRVDSQTKDLYVTYVNVGKTPVYFKSYLVSNVSGLLTKIDDGNVYQLAPGEGRAIKFPAVVKEGSRFVAGAFYGEREAFLEKNVEKQYVPEVSNLNIDLTLLLGIVIILLLIVIAYLVLRKK